MIKLEAISIADKASQVWPQFLIRPSYIPSTQPAAHPSISLSGCAGSKTQKALPYSPSQFTPPPLQGLPLSAHQPAPALKASWVLLLVFA